MKVKKVKKLKICPTCGRRSETGLPRGRSQTGLPRAAHRVDRSCGRCHLWTTITESGTAAIVCPELHIFGHVDITKFINAEIFRPRWAQLGHQVVGGQLVALGCNQRRSTKTFFGFRVRTYRLRVPSVASVSLAPWSQCALPGRSASERVHSARQAVVTYSHRTAKRACWAVLLELRPFIDDEDDQ